MCGMWLEFQGANKSSFAVSYNFLEGNFNSKGIDLMRTNRVKFICCHY